MTDDADAKIEALRKQLDARGRAHPELKIRVVPRGRVSGETTFLLTEDLIARRRQQMWHELPTCQECRDDVIVGQAGLVAGKFCASCASDLGIPRDLPPAA